MTDESTAQPSVSVVMPVRNEEVWVRRSLGAILDQNWPNNRLEVLIVDGMSEDGTREIIDRMAKETDISVRTIDNPERTVPPAMNLGVRAASGEIIVRMDGHTIAEPDYVRKCVETLERTGADNAGGCMTCAATSRFGEAVAAATSHPFGIGGALFHYVTTETEVDTVYLGSWRKQAFGRFGLFDEYFKRTQDSEFNYRTRMLGGRIVCNPQIRSTYYPRSTPAKLWHQYFEYGFWKTRLMKKLGGKLRPRHFAAPLLVAGLAGALVLGLLASAIRSPLLGGAALTLPAVYILAACAATVDVVRKKRPWRLLLFLPPTFACLHLAWGCGFLKGLVTRVPPNSFAPLPTAETE